MKLLFSAGDAQRGFDTLMLGASRFLSGGNPTDFCAWLQTAHRKLTELVAGVPCGFVLSLPGSFRTEAPSKVDGLCVHLMRFAVVFFSLWCAVQEAAGAGDVDISALVVQLWTSGVSMLEAHTPSSARDSALAVAQQSLQQVALLVDPNQN